METNSENTLEPENSLQGICIGKTKDADYNNTSTKDIKRLCY